MSWRSKVGVAGVSGVGGASLLIENIKDFFPLKILRISSHWKYRGFLSNGNVKDFFPLPILRIWRGEKLLKLCHRCTFTLQWKQVWSEDFFTSRVQAFTARLFGVHCTCFAVSLHIFFSLHAFWWFQYTLFLFHCTFLVVSLRTIVFFHCKFFAVSLHTFFISLQVCLRPP